jgi:hypothetical protein
VGIIEDSLDAAERATLTRKPPVSTKARIRFLVRQLGTTRATAQLLGVSQRSVERYLQGTRTRPPQAIAEAIEREVLARWQPLVRGRAVRRAAETGGITVETRARFGFTAAPGSTDDPRLRRVTQHLPPSAASALFEARAAGANEARLAQLLAEGLQEAYFKDGGRRAQQLRVELQDIDYLDLDYR